MASSYYFPALNVLRRTWRNSGPGIRNRVPARFCLMLLVGHWDSLSPLGHLENELGIVGSDCGVCVCLVIQLCLSPCGPMDWVVARVLSNSDLWCSLNLLGGKKWPMDQYLHSFWVSFLMGMWSTSGLMRGLIQCVCLEHSPDRMPTRRTHKWVQRACPQRWRVGTWIGNDWKWLEMIGNYSIGDFKIIRRCPPFRSHCYEMAKIPKKEPSTPFIYIWTTSKEDSLISSLSLTVNTHTHTHTHS